MNDPQVVTPNTTTGHSSRVYTCPEDVMVDYLKDIRNQLANLNTTLNRLIELDYGANVRGIKVVQK